MKNECGESVPGISNLISVRRLRRTGIAIVATLISAASGAADLPTLGNPSTLSGTPTSASFRGGVSSDAGQSYLSSFGGNDPLSITAEIQVEPQHAGSTGNLYVLIQLGNDFFMQNDAGSFSVWDLNPATLQASASDKVLTTIESLTILENIKLGPLGLANASFSIYLAYDSSLNSGEIYFSGSPIALSIAAYDPLEYTSNTTQIIDTTVIDNSRDREIPVLIYLPDTTSPAPVVLFSHGLGGNRFNVVYLAEHWSQRGYAVFNMQHPGSDESILDVPASEVLASFTAAASLENSILRIQDVSAVIDQLEIWNNDSSNTLNQRLDLSRIGMSGHSFGAKTTQSVSGENMPAISEETTDSRIKAATMFSPSIPSFGDPVTAFADVAIPWLLMTGTDDNAVIPGVGSDVEGRLAVFPALPAGRKYELVLFEGEHHAFTDHELSGFQNPRNPAHHPIIKALSTAFWDSWLSSDASAKTWLEGTAAEAILEPGDTWQFK